jgi:hypothetical protein
LYDVGHCERLAGTRGSEQSLLGEAFFETQKERGNSLGLIPGWLVVTFEIKYGFAHDNSALYNKSHLRTKEKLEGHSSLSNLLLTLLLSCPLCEHLFLDGKTLLGLV